MKIIISPSKTQKIVYNKKHPCNVPMFVGCAKGINSILKSKDKDELKAIYKASDAIVDGAYNNIQGFECADSGQAVLSYTGAVFGNMEIDDCTNSQMEYIKDNLRILSAHYGVLQPFDAIKPYRLDYKMKIEGLDLKRIWQTKVNKALGDGLIINLASSEFSTLINKPMITIDFKEKRNGKYRVIGTYAKMARGKMVKMMAQKSINDMQKIKRIEVLGYRYNSEISDEFNYVFTK